MIWPLVLASFALHAGALYLIWRMAKRIEKLEQTPIPFHAHPQNGGALICNLPHDWADGLTQEEQDAKLAQLTAMAAMQDKWN